MLVLPGESIDFLRLQAANHMGQRNKKNIERAKQQVGGTRRTRMQSAREIILLPGLRVLPIGPDQLRKDRIQIDTRQGRPARTVALKFKD